MNSIKSVLTRLLGYRSATGLLDAVEEELHPLFGCNSVCLAPSINPESPEFRRQILFSGDTRIQKIWLKNRWYFDDPLYLHSFKSSEAYHFEDVLKQARLTPRVKTIIQARRDHDRAHGYLVPCLGGTMSMGSVKYMQFTAAELAAVNQIAQPLLNHWFSLCRQEAEAEVKLTPRLQQLLFFLDASQGEPDIDVICTSMGIRESTYRAYRQNLLEIFDSKNMSGVLLRAKATGMLPRG